MQRKNSGFTLIEMLTVLAITAVLLTLIVLPVIQTFTLLRGAQSFADAQDKARTLIERITREMSNAAGVRDNAGIKGIVNVIVPGENGNPVSVSLQYAKLDLIKPAEGDPSLREVGTGAYFNPNTGRFDPTLRSPKGQVVLPVTPGTTIVRYFVARRDPNQAYNNPYDGLLMTRNGARDNLYVLYRAEVPAYNADGTVNAQFFFDLNRDNNPDTRGPWFDDPDFMNPEVPGQTYSTPLPGDPTKAQMIQNWLRRSVIMTEVSRYDFIQPLYDRRTRGVIFDANIPRLAPLIQFRPTSIGSEPTAGQLAVRLGEESDDMTTFAPDVFRTKFGSWSSLMLRIWPSGWNPNLATLYTIGRPNPLQNNDFTEFIFDPLVNTNENTDGLPVFNSDLYGELVRTNSAYPFTNATNFANLGTAALRSVFVPAAVDMSTGAVTTSFGIDEIGSDPGRLDRNPTRGTGPALSPSAGAVGGNWFDPVYSPSDPLYEINTSFNKVYREQFVAAGPINFGLASNLHRFIDLRVHRMTDGSYSPLHPDPSFGFPRAQIVPGSEVVTGPDQNPGPNFGMMVRYSRVTKNPGPNQYRINYADKREPTNPSTNLVDYSLIGLPNPPAVYTANDFVSAIIQPRYRAGYVQLNSDPNVPLPQGNIVVSYRFQMNRAGDTVSADYDSRQLMSVLLTIRNYPQTNDPNPQMITLEGSATIRNVLR